MAPPVQHFVPKRALRQTDKAVLLLEGASNLRGFLPFNKPTLISPTLVLILKVF